MNNLIKLLVTLGLIGLFVAGCANKDDADAFIPVQDLVVADDFNWQISRPVQISLNVLTNTGEPVTGIVFELFNGDPDEQSDAIAKGSTAADGKFETNLNIPNNVTKLWAVGYMSSIELPIVNNRVSYTFGGALTQVKGSDGYIAPLSKAWAYLPGMTFNSSGVPSPMTTVPLGADFLQRIDATLPERKSVPQFHPDYLTPGNQTNIKIDELADVWITFVHEGAGNRNSLGFHSYPSNAEPQTTAQVGTKTILLPNASLANSGGGLQPGNTIFIGRFDPGTSIGWFLVGNGYLGGSGVSTTNPVYYSNTQLNPEANSNIKQHSILVNDAITDRLLVGFEDLNRTTGSDDDFNDLVFFITSNPVEAVDLTGIPPMDIPDDEDGDGISDLFDDYPEDPDLAFNNYTFGENAWGTLSYEDLWPAVGDYDFNDMVIDYNYNQITKAGNLVKKVEMKFKLRAIGARKANGFAVELPFVSSNINSLTPSHPALFEHETDGSKAVLRFFNSTFDLMPQQPSFINTEPDQSYFQPQEFSVSFKLTNTINIVNVALAPPYNPFIFVDGNRSHEIHLPGYTPTNRMNTSLFGTLDDASLPNHWYKTSTNLPWAVNIPASWDYPVERAQLTRAHKKFKQWAQSNGNSYNDWYMDKPDYRDEAYIYQTP